MPEGAERVEASGKVVTPGLVDAHAHVGVYEEGEGWAGNDTNEMTDPDTAQVAAAIDAINPAELGFRDALAGGVPGGQRQPRLGQPDRRPDRRDQDLGPHASTRWCCGSRAA